jgi:hypothetical protein
MFGITRKSLAVFTSALTMTLVLILVLATTASAGSPKRRHPMLVGVVAQQIGIALPTLRV